MPFVDSKRVIIGGQSRGGILSVIYAGQHPEQVMMSAGWAILANRQARRARAQAARSDTRRNLP